MSRAGNEARTSASWGSAADRVVMTFGGRPSDSPFIERVWGCDSHRGGEMLSISAGRLDLVLTRLPGLTVMTVRGPETRPTPMMCPPSGQWFGIRFRPGVQMPQFPMASLTDMRDINLPTADDGSFTVDGTRWQAPDFDTAELFVHRLAQRGLIVRDDAVALMARSCERLLTQRTIQRHFRQATGLTPGMFTRIERARLAAHRLRGGAPILDVVHDCGYFDQAHLTRSVRALIGVTPGNIQRAETQLSLLYETSTLSKAG